MGVSKDPGFLAVPEACVLMAGSLSASRVAVALILSTISWRDRAAISGSSTCSAFTSRRPVESCLLKLLEIRGAAAARAGRSIVVNFIVVLEGRSGLVRVGRLNKRTWIRLWKRRWLSGSGLYQSGIRGRIYRKI